MGIFDPPSLCIRMRTYEGISSLPPRTCVQNSHVKDKMDPTQQWPCILCSRLNLKYIASYICSKNKRKCMFPFFINYAITTLIYFNVVVFFHEISWGPQWQACGLKLHLYLFHHFDVLFYFTVFHCLTAFFTRHKDSTCTGCIKKTQPNIPSWE